MLTTFKRELFEWKITLRFAWENRKRLWHIAAMSRKKMEKEQKEKIRRMKMAMNNVLDEMEKELEQ